MRRRRFLALVLPAAAGCTGRNPRASGPRTPPPSPSGGPASDSTPDPVESRAQAVVRPLNEVYRVVRDPLDDFDVEGVTREDLATADAAIGRAREALAAFSTAVDDPPPRYRSLTTLVRAHGALVDGLTAAVDLQEALAAAVQTRDGSTTRLADARESVRTLEGVAADLAGAVDADPTVPPALFLTSARLDSFAATLDAQTAVAGRLLAATDRTTVADGHWRDGTAAFERRRYDDAVTAFRAARDAYRTATTSLGSDPDAAGSLADLVERIACVAAAGAEAASTAVRAVETADSGNASTAEETLGAARETRLRCTD